MKADTVADMEVDTLLTEFHTFDRFHNFYQISQFLPNFNFVRELDTGVG